MEEINHNKYFLDSSKLEFNNSFLQELIFDTISEIIIITDLFGKILWYSSNINKIFNKQLPEIVVGGNIFDILDKEKIFESRILDSKSIDYEYKKENSFILNISLKEINNDSKIYLFNIKDVTEQRKTEKKLQEQLVFTQNLLDNIPNPIFYKDKKGLYLGCNDAFTNFLGKSKEEIVGKTVFELSPKDLADTYFEKDNALFESNDKTQIYEWKVKNKDGTYHDVMFYKAKFEIDNDNCIVGVILDINDLKKTQQKLMLTQFSVDQAYDAIFWLDYYGKLLYVNKSGIDLMNLFGYSDFSISVFDIFNIKNQNWERLWQDKKQVFYDYELQITDKQNISIEININFIESGDVTYLCAFTKDITKRKLTEKQLIRKEQELLAIIASLDDLVFEVDEDFTFINVWTNDNNLLFVPKSEFIGKTFLEVLGEEYGKMFENVLIDVKNTGKPKELDYFVNIKGQKKWFTEKVSPVKTENGTSRKFSILIRDITERKTIEEERNAMAQKLMNLIETVDEGITLSDESGFFEIFNSKMEEITGYTREEANKTRNFLRLLYPEDKFYHEAQAGIYEIYNQGGCREIETIIQTKNGIYKNLLVSTSIFFSNDNKLFLSSYRDITQRVNTLKALKESEEKYRYLTEKTDDIIWIVDLEMNFKYISPSVEKQLGFTPQEFIDLPLNQKFPEDSLAFINKIYTNKYESSKNIDVNELINKSVVFELKLLHKDGNIIWVEVNSSFLLNEKNEIIGANGVTRNINERKKREELRAYLAAVIEATDDIAIIKDLNSNLIATNNAFAKILNKKNVKDLIGKHFKDIFTNNDNLYPINQHLEDDIIVKGLNKGETLIREESLQYPDGKIRYFHTRKFPIYDNNDNIIATANISSDITERKKAEEALRESEERFRKLFEQAPDAVFMIHPFGYLLDINNKACQSLGYTRGELLKMKVADFEQNFSSNNLLEISNRIMSKGSITFEGIHKRKDNTTFPVEVTANNFKYSDQSVILGFARDITERKLLERKILSTIIETEEKERKRFAEDLHDGLGPFLSAVMLYVNDMFSEKSVNKITQKKLSFLKEMIDEAILSTRNIANNLMPGVLHDFGLYKAINSFSKKINLIKNYNFKIESNVKNKRYDSILEVILYRITTELINNTLKHSKAKSIYISINETDNILTLIFNDDGCGFDIKQIIDENTGLGLRNIINRVKSLNGRYEFESETNNGFKIEININLKNYYL